MATAVLKTNKMSAVGEHPVPVLTKEKNNELYSKHGNIYDCCPIFIGDSLFLSALG